MILQTGLSRSTPLTTGGSTPLTTGGFSLLELLVVAALLGVISLATYSALSVGVRVWKRVGASVQELDLVLGWKMLRKDLLSRIPFSAIGFAGTEQGFAFPGLVTVRGEGGIAHDEVGRIRYLFDESGQYLCREEVAYKDLVQGLTADCRPVITSVDNVTFEYYGREEGEGGIGNWYQAWEGGDPPLAVRLEVALKGTGGKDGMARQYTVVLP